ncbi:MAG: hypothetical protein BWZ10_00647 [candidate division BRC1 bacterium ADurb.BinA364]|nr:MAG: hypothetical protein BWZ10_00647 [candidate division BRC1 bacterium ADurb.BinA364]
MLPLNAREYLVSYPAGTEDAMFGRACLCRVAERTMVQIEWFGTARGDLPNDQRVYQYGVYSVDGETLTFQLLNSDVVSKDIKSAEELAKAIEANRENPNLFKEKMVFRKSAD